MENVNDRYVLHRALYGDFEISWLFLVNLYLSHDTELSSKIIEQTRPHGLLSVAWQLEEGGCRCHQFMQIRFIFPPHFKKAYFLSCWNCINTVACLVSSHNRNPVRNTIVYQQFQDHCRQILFNMLAARFALLLILGAYLVRAPCGSSA